MNKDDKDFLEKAIRHTKMLTPDGELRLFDCVRDLQAENAALRELVRAVIEKLGDVPAGEILSVDEAMDMLETALGGK